MNEKINILAIHPKTIAACGLFQAKNNVRYYLNGIYFEPGKNGGVVAVATDGHSMLAVYDEHATIEAPIIVEFQPYTITQCRGKNPGALLAVNRVADTECLVSLQLPGHTMNCRLIEGKYPDWRSVMPDSLPESVSPVHHLNSAYLEKMSKAAQILSTKKTYTSTYMVSRDRNNSVLFVFNAPMDGLIARGCIMPMSLDSAPVWGEF